MSSLIKETSVLDIPTESKLNVLKVDDASVPTIFVYANRIQSLVGDEFGANMRFERRSLDWMNILTELMSRLCVGTTPDVLV